MTIFISVLILLCCVVMSFFILIQKPKGGGLSGTFGSLGSQVMGVKQSGDAMEKGTWYLMALIGILSILGVFTMGPLQRVQAAPNEAPPQEQQAPAPMPTAPSEPTQ